MQSWEETGRSQSNLLIFPPESATRRVTQEGRGQPEAESGLWGPDSPFLPLHSLWIKFCYIYTARIDLQAGKNMKNKSKIYHPFPGIRPS